MRTKVPVDNQLVTLSEVLDRARIVHAFGGWIAQGYYASLSDAAMRARFSLRVFAAPHEQVRLHCDLLGIEVVGPAGHLRAAKALLVSCGDGPDDRAAARRIVRVPFGEDTLPILSAEDLIIDELHRAKPDWQQIEQILFCRLGELDADYLLWALAGLPEDDRRKRKFGTIARAFAGLEREAPTSRA